MDRVTILGARGSVPRAGSEFARFGGDTTCILAELAGEALLLDAGTGLMNCPLPPAPEDRPLSLLLSHFHTDHLLGLALSPLLMDGRNHLHIYAGGRDAAEAEALLDRMFSPPLWPVRLRDLPAEVRFLPLPERLQLGALTVETAPGFHPGGVTLMKLSGGGHTVVFMPDCTVTDENLPALAEFARDCDLLLCDGQYSDEEWAFRSSFGHSTWSRAVRLALVCQAKKLRIIHHDPYHTDRMLAEAQAQLTARYPDFGFAQDQEVIVL